MYCTKNLRFGQHRMYRYAKCIDIFAIFCCNMRLQSTDCIPPTSGVPMGLFDFLRSKRKPSSATYRPPAPPPAKKKIPVTQPKKTERPAQPPASNSQDDTSSVALSGLLYGAALHDSHASHDSGASSMHHSSDSGWSGGSDSGGGSFGGGGDF